MTTGDWWWEEAGVWQVSKDVLTAAAANIRHLTCFTGLVLPIIRSAQGHFCRGSGLLKPYSANGNFAVLQRVSSAKG